MKRSLSLVCLILIFLLVLIGIPAVASPTITDFRPVSGTNTGDVTVTITGTGFTTQSTAWMSPSSFCDPDYKIYGTGCSWSSTSGTCTFSLRGQTPALYAVFVNTPILVPGGSELPDMASLTKRFEIYQSGGTSYTINPRPVITTYGPAGPYGTIYVESSPSGAVIYLNDENEGHAPVTITGLWPGSYTISAELAGYQKYTTATTISGSTRSSVFCQMVPDKTSKGLYIVSNPDRAKVYLDGILKGETPLMLSDIASGSHTLQVKRAEYDEWKTTVWVPDSGTKTVSAVLNKNNIDLPQGINVSSVPSGADVLLDGLKKGVTPIILKNIAAGIHVVEIGYPGYISWKSTVDVPETEIKDLAINLVPKAGKSPGSIMVVSDPFNALVTLDGNYVGQTSANSSLNLQTVTPGEHTLGLALSGYKPYSTNITVSQNQVSVVNVTLIPVLGPLAKGALSVASDPTGASITIDNTTLGISPLTVNDIAVGNHLITITLEGYQDYSTSILVAQGTTSTISVPLLKLPATLHSPALPLTALGALGILGFLARRKPE
jgi:hypothetical protein